MYVCEVCGLEGFNKVVMEKHMADMHVCQLCKTVHKDVYELNRHKEKEHAKECHICAVCLFRAESDHNLSVHMSSHDSTAHHQCEICGKACKTEDAVNEHIQNTHVKEMFQYFVDSKKKTVKSSTRPDFHKTTSVGRPYSSEDRRM